MKYKIKKVVAHPLVTGGAVIIFGSMAANVFNFLFNIFMSRNLSVVDYGALASLISIISLFSFVSGALSPTVVRFAGEYFAKEDFGAIRGIYKIVGGFTLALGFVFFLIFTLFSELIAQFFHIPYTSLLIISGFIIFIIFAGVVNSSLLQAKLLFKLIALFSLVGAGLRFILGVILYFLGLGITGALWALFVSSLVSYALSFIPLRSLFFAKLRIPRIDTLKLLLYGLPSAVTIFATTSLITSDILLVKHYFSAEQAGVYAGLSLVGRVIFFISAPIGTVMFPLITQRHAKRENYQSVLIFALLLVLIPSMLLTAFYFLFPEFSIKFFIRRSEYLKSAGLLGFFGVFITLYSVLTLLSSFFLSIKQTKIWLPLLLGAVCQAVLIFFYHGSFFQIISISLSVVVLLLVILIFLYWRTEKENLSRLMTTVNMAFLEKN